MGVKDVYSNLKVLERQQPEPLNPKGKCVKEKNGWIKPNG